MTHSIEGTRMIGRMLQSRKALALAAPLGLAAIALLCPAAAQTAAEAPVASASLLPSDLSPWGMFLSADSFVKAVMILLAFASFVTWTVALAKGVELSLASRKLSNQIAVLQRAPTLAKALDMLRGQDELEQAALEAQAEMEASEGLDPGGAKERIASRLERLEAQASRMRARATGILATTGATAPFVGLFGTVWGVMNSFIGISKQHTTNLAVVSPGIAEALLATALGLAAAIPAVVFYNMLARSIAGYRARHADGSAAILRLASRDLDRASVVRSLSARSRSSAAE